MKEKKRINPYFYSCCKENIKLVSGKCMLINVDFNDENSLHCTPHTCPLILIQTFFFKEIKRQEALNTLKQQKHLILF